MESIGECDEVSEGNVSFSSLNGSYKGSVEVSGISKGFLSVPHSSTAVPNHAAQSYEESVSLLFCAHRVQSTGQQAVSLHHISGTHGWAGDSAKLWGMAIKGVVCNGGATRLLCVWRLFCPTHLDQPSSVSIISGPLVSAYHLALENSHSSAVSTSCARTGLACI